MFSFSTHRNYLVKTISALIAAAALLSACAGTLYTDDAEEIRAVADAISAYSVPQGYAETFAADLMGYKLVNLQGPLPSCHIYLVQAPKDVDLDVDGLRKQAQNLEGSKSQDRPRDMRVVEQREVTVRGETVIMLVSEGRNSENLLYREVTVAFIGRGGLALLSMSAPVEQWDWEMVDQFIASFS